MSDIVYFNVPYYGHIDPTLGLVQELTRRGEKVDYYCTEEFQHRIECTGAQFQPLPSQLDPKSFYTMEAYGMETSLELLPVLSEQVKRDSPKLFMFESTCLLGCLLSQLLHLPTVSTHTVTFVPPSFSFPMSELLAFTLSPRLFPFLSALHPISEGSTLEKLQWFFNNRNLWKKLKQLYSVGNVELNKMLRLQGDLNVILLPEYLPIKRDLYDESYIFTGPCYLDLPPESDFPLDQLEGESVIYISLGTFYNQDVSFFKKCLQAFGHSNHRVVMTVGKSLDIQLLGEIPANFIVRNWVPQLEVLKYAKLFITHGGLNGVLGGLMNQVPLLVFPRGADQFFLASRVQKLGAGIWLKKNNFKPVELQQIAEKVMNSPDIRRNVEKLGNWFGKAGGSSRASDKIIEFKNNL
ncbi:macrolide family glycosyltransferase [Moorena sp. SIO4G3]|uniref:macrolide family glycosyltransferase n=1 Tax=Moorena sp. SIO4G3 TaxID=2607821 RepID=UPI00142AA30C|nr:macrolide family glycosyltransferase [Moorena sp. SIO4G3]NEO79842.1 hypothetical protein [Moorena sp. SIO4G3]